VPADDDPPQGRNAGLVIPAKGEANTNAPHLTVFSRPSSRVRIYGGQRRGANHEKAAAAFKVPATRLTAIRP
jgi:hypothetical protein